MCIVVQYSHKSVRPVQTGTEVCESVVSVAEKGCFVDMMFSLASVPPAVSRQSMLFPIATSASHLSTSLNSIPGMPYQHATMHNIWSPTSALTMASSTLQLMMMQQAPPVSRPWPNPPLFALSQPVYAHSWGIRIIPEYPMPPLNPLAPSRANSHLSNALPNTPTPLHLVNAFPTRCSFDLSSPSRQVDSQHPHSFPTQHHLTFTLLRQVYSRCLIGLTTVVGRSLHQQLDNFSETTYLSESVWKCLKCLRHLRYLTD